jgi:hypothetical protein
VKLHAVIAAVLVGLGLLLLFAAFTNAESVREHIASEYQPTGKERVEGARTDSLVYESGRPPSETAEEIADAVKPADRRVSPSGIFLRYDEDFVTVVPRTEGGSTIYVDDEDAGYHRGFFFLGGWWGTYSGRGESFRGGGPGGGK